MEIFSVENLCKFLISCAFQRCRKLDDLCRLSVFLKPEPPLVRISVSDTGVVSILEELQELKIQRDTTLASKWDGVLSVATTSISDNEIHHFKLDMKEIVSSKRLLKLPSATKNGAIFSGTEVSLSINEKADSLLATIADFIRKMLVLKSTKIAMELSFGSEDASGVQVQNIILQNTCRTLPTDAPNIDCLKLGLEDYISKHENRLAEYCQSCFSSGKNLRVGTGVAHHQRNHLSGEKMMEAVIIISETSVPTQTSCFRLYGRKTEVLYYRDFSPCRISSSSLDALTGIAWKNYGLSLKSFADEDGVALLEWGDLPASTHIDILLHRYNEQSSIHSCSENNRADRILTTKCVKLALNELKERNPGVLLSERALKISKYAPDLARTISGLVLSSNDSSFREQCLSLMCLQPQGSERNTVENSIKDRLMAVISRNDTKSRESREASYLFVNDSESRHEPLDVDEEYEELRYADL